MCKNHSNLCACSVRKDSPLTRTHTHTHTHTDTHTHTFSSTVTILSWPARVRLMLVADVMRWTRCLVLCAVLKTHNHITTICIRCKDGVIVRVVWSGTLQLSQHNTHTHTYTHTHTHTHTHFTHFTYHISQIEWIFAANSNEVGAPNFTSHCCATHTRSKTYRIIHRPAKMVIV